MIHRIHHISISTPDITALVDFYQNFFGGEVVRQMRWQEGNAAFNARLGVVESAGQIVLMNFGNTCIEFVGFDVPEELPRPGVRAVTKPGFSHIAFAVGDCEAEYARLYAAGMKFHAPPLRMPAGGIFVYGRDPDGNIVELIQPPKS